MADALYRYLRELQHPVTGLLESFSSSTDPSLVRVAFTYDLALAGLVFTQHGALDEAHQLLEFYRSMPLPVASSFDYYNTAYQTEDRLPALEQAIQVGPVAWVAVALLQYARASGQLIYLHKAAVLLDWLRRHLDHFHGGIVMGAADPWSTRLSAENNWAYYAALRLVVRDLSEGALRSTLQEEKEGVRRWLARNGSRRGEGDPVKALDVYTNALLVGPTAHLEEQGLGDRIVLGQWAKSWIEELEALFRVPDAHVYDYTDAREARRADRPRVGWLEGTGQVALAYQTWAPFFESLGDPRYAQELLRRASLAHACVLRSSLLAGGGVAIPNTDAPEPVKTFADGWYARPSGEPALNGTTWAYFVETGCNPWLPIPALVRTSPSLVPAV